ncbi:hypothetical protein B0H13DRAFT_2323241 [Mycena leptocephala]|nr:hypothetical protein B0H13DRAFT_2323241 [Mycena leptocephala]
MTAHHIAAMLVPSWGHTVSYLYIATQMLQKDPTLVISLVQHNVFVAQMEAELKMLTYDTARLHIIGLGDKEMSLHISPAAIKEAFGQMIGGWMQTLPQLAQGNEEWPKPHAIHVHLFSTESLPQPSMPAYLTDYNFTAIAQDIFDDDARRQGRSKEDILDQVCIRELRSLGIPPADYGICIARFRRPGSPTGTTTSASHSRLAPPAGVAPILVSAQKLAKLVDGILVPSSTCIEPVGAPQCREFHRVRGQELFTVGLQANELCWTDASSDGLTNEVVKSFLDGALQKYGHKSVLYISFGSLWFPLATPQLVEALVDTLLALDTPFPFIFALGGKMASLPDALVERVSASGRGLVCKFWVEQRAILQHAALGWFLTHGGWNSVSNSLSLGIPLIIWPTNSEQPVNAALLVFGAHPVAIELMRVRTGTQLAPALRGGPTITGTVADASAEFKAAFDDARGLKGAVLVENAAKMAAALRVARAGEAAEELVRLAKF